MFSVCKTSKENLQDGKYLICLTSKLRQLCQIRLKIKTPKIYLIRLKNDPEKQPVIKATKMQIFRTFIVVSLKDEKAITI